MADPTDLQGETNRFYRLFKEFRDESQAVTISKIAFVVSLLAVLMSWMAEYNSSRADAKVDHEIHATRQEMTDLKDQIEIRNIRIANLEALMRAHGIDIPEEDE